jgi:hypothetical protein
MVTRTHPLFPGQRESPAMASAAGVADHFLVSFSFILQRPNAEEDGKKV